MDLSEVTETGYDVMHKQEEYTDKSKPISVNTGKLISVHWKIMQWQILTV